MRRIVVPSIERNLPPQAVLEEISSTESLLDRVEDKLSKILQMRPKNVESRIDKLSKTVDRLTEMVDKRLELPYAKKEAKSEVDYKQLIDKLRESIMDDDQGEVHECADDTTLDDCKITLTAPDVKPIRGSTIDITTMKTDTRKRDSIRSIYEAVSREIDILMHQEKDASRPFLGEHHRVLHNTNTRLIRELRELSEQEEQPSESFVNEIYEQQVVFPKHLMERFKNTFIEIGRTDTEE